MLTALSKSQIYRDYNEALEEATGRPLDFNAPGLKVFRPEKEEAPAFCALMAKSNQSCAECYALQKKLEKRAKLDPKNLKCFAGLCETAVPVRVGENLIAFLYSGHVLVDSPDQVQFNRVAEQLIRWGTQVDLKQAQDAYFAATVLSPTQYQWLVRLLAIFAQQLAACGTQLAVQQTRSQPSAVSRARKIIDLRYQEDISLSKIAGLVNVSATYFSEVFKKATGMNFVEYVARVRIEQAKHLLQNPNKRIGEIALEAGFHSLSQFNRDFKRFTGQAPKAFRATLPSV